MIPSKGGKRCVSSCEACYTRKQKVQCNRRYPCNHCTRRRRPEECVYHAFTAAQSLKKSATAAVEVHVNAADSQRTLQDTRLPVYENLSQSEYQVPTLLQSFGYPEDSGSNTVALLKALGPGEVERTLMHNKSTLPSILASAQNDIALHMPERSALDFLMQYYISRLNWMKQLVHAPSFLASYNAWWNQETPLGIADIEFAVLILRIALYTMQFLPPDIQGIDSIAILNLPEIQSRCASMSETLAKACAKLDWKGSLVRVQHSMFAAIKSSCEGRTDKFWEGIASASQAAQKAGIHLDPSGVEGLTELDKEMRRRVFCSIFLLDSHLARQLDRVPFVPGSLDVSMLPKMQLFAHDERLFVAAGAPECFTERLMQVQLAQFWKKFPRKPGYDAAEAEHRYERFCSEYISNLPPALALVPDTKWDKSLPKLSMQRDLLHLTLFDSIAWNFRPLLLLEPSQVACLPPYKKVLIKSQKYVLASACLRELEAIASLHSKFNDSEPRFGAIISNTFEASVLLVLLCMQTDFADHQPEASSHILDMEVGRLSRKKVLLTAQKGLDRLQTIESDMASSGARTLAKLLAAASGGLSGGETILGTPTDAFGAYAPEDLPFAAEMDGVFRDPGPLPPSDYMEPYMMPGPLELSTIFDAAAFSMQF